MTTTTMLRAFCDAVEQHNGRAYADLFTDGVPGWRLRGVPE